jgi:MipA family protein
MKTALVACAAMLAVSTPALAQDENDYRVRVGLGGQIKPKFVGSDESQILPLFDFDLARGTEPYAFEAPDDSFGIRLFSKGGFSAGPAANIQSKRKNSDVGADVGKVSTTVEVGGFVQYQAGKSIRLRGDLRKGIGGHDGLVGSFGADYVWRDGDKYVFSIGPRVLAALATGLPTYRPNGGIYALAATSGLSYQFDSRFGLFGYARYERLVGDAADSPIIREYGSRNQFAGGLGLNYTFTVKR